MEPAPVTVQPYHLALKHHNFLKQEIKNLLDTWIIHKSMFQWASPFVVVKKHKLEGLPQQFHQCVDYGKLNSLLPAVIPSMDTKKGAPGLMALPKIDELFALSKGAIIEALMKLKPPTSLKEVRY